MCFFGGGQNKKPNEPAPPPNAPLPSPDAPRIGEERERENVRHHDSKRIDYRHHRNGSRGDDDDRGGRRGGRGWRDRDRRRHHRDIRM